MKRLKAMLHNHLFKNATGILYVAGVGALGLTNLVRNHFLYILAVILLLVLIAAFLWSGHE